MCQIASLFLLQRLKGSMSGDACDLNVMKFPPPCKAQKEIDANLIKTLGEHAPSYVTIKNCMVQFKRGVFYNCYVSRPGQPKTVITPEIIDQIHELILEEHWIMAKSMGEQLGISRERPGCTIHKDLDMPKLSAKWVLKCLNTNQKCQRCQSSEEISNFSFRDW
jgi:hypothetical protein